MSIVSKVCEKIVLRNLVTFWISRNVFTSGQFGFMKNTYFTVASRERNKGKTTDVIFLDLSKAFDSVPEEVGQPLAKHHGKFACALLIGFIHALTSAK